MHTRSWTTYRWAASLVMTAAWAALGQLAEAQTRTTTKTKAAATPPAQYQVFAWNDLGMHCYDSDFSVFSLLPPFNTVHAQVVRKGTTPVLCSGNDVSVFYSATADPHGSVNSTSKGKTNFWAYSQWLYGAALPVDMGLVGETMPGAANTPQSMVYDNTRKWASAYGIPITDIDDAGRFNTYPMLRFQARPKGQTTVATAVDAVVPVSSEMDCKACHANQGIAANPTHVQLLGLKLSTSPDPDIQGRENILRLHDIRYKTTLWQSRPVLCAGCHYSKALDLGGKGPVGAQVGHEYLSQAMHLRHGKTFDNQLPTSANPAVISATGVQACYQCHPGGMTNCLRGVMSGAGVGCQNCHGGLLAVGGQYRLSTGKIRDPWTDLPKCQSCHTGDLVTNLGGGVPRLVAFNPADSAATPVSAPNSRFAENPGQLYRNSTGHGGLACSACHGSPHAEWPAVDPNANDNVTARQLQGHDGPVVECAVCHGNNLAPTMKGPHGMHNVNSQAWVSGHHDVIEKAGGLNACKACHGLKLEGTYMTEAFVDRVFQVEDKRMVKISHGTAVGCSQCHQNPLQGKS